MPCWKPSRPPASLDDTSMRAARAESDPPREYQTAIATDADVCDYCASPRIVWRKCKLICEQCGQINKSCADL
jgi:hypothetical protein